jgi:hypothetical protein
LGGLNLCKEVFSQANAAASRVPVSEVTISSMRLSSTVILALLSGTYAMEAASTPKKNSYLDATLSPAKRARDLLRRMTWDEKIGQLGGVRRAFGSRDGKPDFNRTAFEQTRSTQNGQIGMTSRDLSGLCIVDI